MSKKIVLGITQGDSNGIGYEVIIKAFADARLLDLCTPVLYGSSRAFGFYKKMIPETDNLNSNIVNSAKDAHPKRINIVNCVSENLLVEPGQPTADAGKAAVMALRAAVEDLKAGTIDALVTAPFNKHTVYSEEFKFPGHTEFFIEQFGAKDGLMFLCADKLRVGVVTGHLPISEVPKAITTDKIVEKLRIMNNSLMRDFNIVKPKIAVIGLNPHAGDTGLLGNEEQNAIIPSIKIANEEDILAFGPFSADGFFGTDMQYKFDAVLAMYHDQGLVPFKVLAFDDGVNFTAGLPIIRTSPDHGTAYDLAGKNMANALPMISAIYAAIDIFRNRVRYDDMRVNPLKIENLDA